MPLQNPNFHENIWYEYDLRSILGNNLYKNQIFVAIPRKLDFLLSIIVFFGLRATPIDNEENRCSFTYYTHKTPADFGQQPIQKPENRYDFYEIWLIRFSVRR